MTERPPNPVRPSSEAIAPATGTYRWARPLLFRLDAERAHEWTLAGAARAAGSRALCRSANALFAAPRDPRLAVDAWGLRFDNPVGLAAGLDKDGVAIDFWAALGFGFVEVGTVTPGEGQPGNEGPRLARFPATGALLNRMGFNNQGAPALRTRLSRRRCQIPVGANIGKAKATPLDRAPDDYAEAAAAVADVSDFLVVNVSSPNTPGLRDLQSIEALGPILDAVERHGGANKPTLLKVAPDLDAAALDGIAELAAGGRVQGLIATNTTVDCSGLGGPAPFAGGVSGLPLKDRALEVVRHLFRRTEGRVPLVGVGGIFDAEDAWRRIRAGATLVQIYTGFVYGGPGVVRSIVDGLADRVEQGGLRSIAEAVGADV
ncbi:MAG TPA: quinone-dependent dihydroorotate dehydrogenase [Myxococcales bacterium LLY-WYZ-16_1]|jgi:dihydroorotate dehydrogenase|nr:quinone-dependent dihydroorotate dehydrogenase [Myxococcales bacterium LLY-WYZ-16_1]